MRKNTKLIFFLILIYFNIQFDLKSDDFYFEGQEIQILNEGNKLLSKKGVKIISNDNLVFEGNEFEYDKLLEELILSKNVIISDTNKNIKIKTNKLKYLKKDQKILTEDSTDININDKYIIKSENIIFDRSKGILSSNNNTSIKDDFNNQLLSSEFKFFIQEELIKAKEVMILDEMGNKTLLENFFGNLNEGQFFGKDVKINFDKILKTIRGCMEILFLLIKIYLKFQKEFSQHVRKMINVHLGKYLLKKLYMIKIKRS